MGQGGWELATALPGPRRAFGTDRHGKIVSKDVALQDATSTDVVVFLGTEACFGVFAPETILINKAGNQLTARFLAESNDLGASWFENVVSFPFSITNADLSLLSAALATNAPFCSESRLARRCISGDVAVSGVCRKFCSLLKVDNHVFSVVNRKALEACEIQQWDAVIRLGKIMYEEEEGDDVCFETRDAPLAAWYYSALASSGRHYRISYDSIQHSLFAKVQQTDERQSPFKNARCGYLERNPQEKVRIVWDDSSWSPIVNGFLIKGT